MVADDFGEGVDMGGGRWWRLGEGWSVGDEADAADDQEDAGPAVEADVLAEPEVREEGDHDVSEGGGGEDKGEVSPGEGGKVACEKAEEADDSGDDPGVGECVEEHAEVLEADGADLCHAVGEEGIADAGGEHDREEDEVTSWGEGVGHVGLQLEDGLGCAGAELRQEGGALPQDGGHCPPRIEG